MMDGVIAVDEGEGRDEGARQPAAKELKAKLAAADEPPPLLHPEMAELYRQKVTTLAQALEHPETRTEATEALRGLIDAIVLTPDAGRTSNRAEGESGGDAGRGRTNAKRSPETGDLSLQVCDGCGGRI